MKNKILSTGLIMTLLISILVSLTGCGSEGSNQEEGQQSGTSLSSVVKVGDYVSYNAGSENTYTSTKAKNGVSDITYKTTGDEKWRVLSVNEDGTVELISEKGIASTDGKTLGLSQNGTGYANAIDELNNICAIYGKGANAISARSMTYADAIKIIGFDKFEEKFDVDLSSYNTEEEKINKVLELLAKRNDTKSNNNYGEKISYDEKNNYIPSKTDESGYEQNNSASYTDSYIYITHIENELVDNEDTMSLLVGTESGQGCWLATDFQAQGSYYPSGEKYIQFGLYYTAADLKILRNSSIDPTVLSTSSKESTYDQTNCYVRAVVTLDKNTTTTDGDGSSSNTYKLDNNEEANEEVSTFDNKPQESAKEEIEEDVKENIKVGGYAIEYGIYQVRSLVAATYIDNYETTLEINKDNTCVFTEKDKKTGAVTETKTGTIKVDGNSLIIQTDKSTSGCIIDDTYNVVSDDEFESDIWSFSYIKS